MVDKAKQSQEINKESFGTAYIVIIGIVLVWGMITLPKVFIGPLLVVLLIAATIIYVQVRERKRLISADISDIDQMAGNQFEEYLSILFSNMGYRVEDTPTSGDYGADLILKKGRKKIAVQAKRYSSNVGISAVQEVIGAKNYYKANEIWVVTNSYFTKAAVNLGNANNVRLINRDQLLLLIRKSCVYSLKQRSRIKAIIKRR
jgi:restriction system protein